MSFVKDYLHEAKQLIDQLDILSIEEIVAICLQTKEKRGRLFILGVGGSAATAAHFVNDIRKIACIEAYAPTDSVAELTARTNDEGWASVFSEWLKTSQIRTNDAVFIFSVGGGDIDNNISPNIVSAIDLAQKRGAKICGVVGRDGGYTAKMADACLVIPTVEPSRITPHVESFHSVIAHLIVSHPSLRQTQTKWESVK